jgi:transposase, IS5 family
VQAKMAKALKNRASKQSYISVHQPLLEGFYTPFAKQLNSNNRWVVLANKIPWDELVSVYRQEMDNHKTGAEGINPRVAIGSLIIKHLCDLSDRETVQQIQENMYMQYFIGYSSFSDEVPFDASLFVLLRNRLGVDQINIINEKILGLSVQKDNQPKEKPNDLPSDENASGEEKNQTTTPATEPSQPSPTHQGKMIIDATACPQDIRYPTDLHLLNDAREKTEELIDFLHIPAMVIKKPRTYRQKARKMFLKTAQKKTRSKREIRQSIRKQLGYVRRNIENINRLLDYYQSIPFDKHQHNYFFVIQTLYAQQEQMYRQKSHSVEDRIVSIHQPHVRPIVRGKTNANVEFGAKIQVSLMNGFAFLEDLSWDAFNEGTRLMKAVGQYKKRFGYYPKEVLADKIYCSRVNRAQLKELNITLKAKPLGRPRAVAENHVSPGERNPIEGKFGQAKTAYGLNRIKARLRNTSRSWIATIIMVLNLVKLTGQVPYYLYRKWRSYSAQCVVRLGQWIVGSVWTRGNPNSNFAFLTYSAGPKYNNITNFSIFSIYANITIPF